ncbi:unnamed protein product [Heterobilharzia americana]|nr:unnamed protein product [Heterobilharzia americana]CAH8470061.1 unnamed protein product [Heterobilharzia americana]
MPVSYWVLCCSKCFLFQVHHSKKSKTWICKVCSCKQSVLKVFAEGSSQDCRKVVQKLNKEGIERQAKLCKYGIANHPSIRQWNPNKNLPSKIISTENRLSEDSDLTNEEDINSNTDEVSYKLYPCSKPSNSLMQTSAKSGKHSLFPTSIAEYPGAVASSSLTDDSFTDASRKSGSKWDVYL